MNDPIRIATITALVIGSVLSVSAIGLWLLRKTQGLKGTVRIKAMAEIACEKIVSVLPSRRTVFACLVGTNAYLTSLAICSIINLIINFVSIRLMPRETPTGGDWDGFADALMGLVMLSIGFSFSLCVSFVVALLFVESALKHLDASEKFIHQPAA